MEGSGMFCSQCGNTISEGSRFCQQCGQSQGVVSTGYGTAAVLAPATSPQPKKQKSRVPVLLSILLFLLALIGYGVWQSAGTNGMRTMVGTAVHLPVTLNDEVENIHAASWKAIALNLPYSGNVTVNLSVVRGNPIDVFLVSTDQLETIKAGQWRNVQVYSDFNATKSKAYRRTQRLSQGSYYLVLRDTSLGILSESASDVSVKAELNP
jgi:hypothetical protein